MRSGAHAASAGLSRSVPMNAIEAVVRILDREGIRYALIGGRAVALRGHPRMTLDYDFLSADERVMRSDFWQSLRDQGASVDIRIADADDPLGGLVRIKVPHDTDVDVLLAKWKWEREVIERSEPLDVAGLLLPVPVASDLILLKLAAGGPIDQQDVLALLAADRETLIAEVDQKIDRVRPSVASLWQKIRAEASAL